jgi:tRNA (guanine37-N1)-methyltransferase
MNIDVITIFPEMFGPFLETGMVRVARATSRLHVRLWDLRDFTVDRHRKVDDRPYGGGPGMVLRPEPIFRAVGWIECERGAPGVRVLLGPGGVPFSDPIARDLATADNLTLICGRYEGFDERVRLGLEPREISIGDYVLTGGELAAMVVVDALVRWIPGVLGDSTSATRDAFSEGTLGFPQYTRPPNYQGMTVPEVLRSGNHAAINRWRREEAWRQTRERRRDLLSRLDVAPTPGIRSAASPQQSSSDS